MNITYKLHDPIDRDTVLTLPQILKKPGLYYQVRRRTLVDTDIIFLVQPDSPDVISFYPGSIMVWPHSRIKNFAFRRCESQSLTVSIDLSP